METVSVAELKSRLSYYLREVRAGKSYTVVSRDIPVATLRAYEPPETDDLEIIEPDEDATLWGQVEGQPLARAFDVVAMIREDRDDRDERLSAILLESLRDREGSGRKDGPEGEESP